MGPRTRPDETVAFLANTSGWKGARWVQHIPLRMLGLVLFAAILYRVGPSEIISGFARISLWSLVGSCVGCGVLLGARSVRWHALVRRTGKSPSIGQNLFACNESIWLGAVTPGRLGEFRRAFDLHWSTGRPLGSCSTIVLFDLALDLAIFALLAGVGLLVAKESGEFVYILSAGTGFLLFVAVLSSTRFFLRPFARFFARCGMDDFASVLSFDLGVIGALQISFLSLIAALAYVLMVGMLTDGFHLALNTHDLVTMVALVGVSGALPVTYFGLGTREAVLIWYLGGFGHPSSTAIAVSAMFLLALLIAIVLSYAVGLIMKPLCAPQKPPGLAVEELQ